jgi:hypothetical protein
MMNNQDEAEAFFANAMTNPTKELRTAEFYALMTGQSAAMAMINKAVEEIFGIAQEIEKETGLKFQGLDDDLLPYAIENQDSDPRLKRVIELEKAKFAIKVLDAGTNNEMVSHSREHGCAGVAGIEAYQEYEYDAARSMN